MKGYERLQTIIGREITGDELSMVDTIFKTSMDFFCQEESTKPWIIEPETIDFQIKIDDIKLIDKISEKANARNISLDEFVNRIVEEYANSLPPMIMRDEQAFDITPSRGITRKYKIIDFKGHLQWARKDDDIYVVDPLYLDKFLKHFPGAIEIKLIDMS